MKIETINRYSEALSMRKNGKTFNEIGLVLGVGGQRARQIVHRALRIENNNEKWRTDELWLDGINSMIRKALPVAALKSEDALRKFVVSGGLDGCKVGRIGRESLLKFLGMAVPAPKKRKVVPVVTIQKAIQLLERHGYVVLAPEPGRPE